MALGSLQIVTARVSTRVGWQALILAEPTVICCDIYQARVKAGAAST